MRRRASGVAVASRSGHGIGPPCPAGGSESTTWPHPARRRRDAASTARLTADSSNNGALFIEIALNRTQLTFILIGFAKIFRVPLRCNEDEKRE
jgi:hypothetical protein